MYPPGGAPPPGGFPPGGHPPGGGYPPQAPPPGPPAGAPAPLVYNPQQGYVNPGQPVAQAAAAPGRIELDMSFFPLMWVLYLVSPKVEINRQPQQSRWGKHYFDLPAAQYEISVYFPYIFQDRCGMATTIVPVWVGHTTQVKYEAPMWFVFSAGTMRVTGHFPTPGMPQLPPSY